MTPSEHEEVERMRREKDESIRMLMEQRDHAERQVAELLGRLEKVATDAEFFAEDDLPFGPNPQGRHLLSKLAKIARSEEQKESTP